MSLPLQFVVMVAFAVVFLVSHLGDVLLVGHAKTVVGTLHCNRRSNRRTGRGVERLELHSRIAKASQQDTTEETAVVAEQYTQRIVIELKGALVWVLAAVWRLVG